MALFEDNLGFHGTVHGTLTVYNRQQKAVMVINTLMLRVKGVYGVR
jgi:hypothetical protein